jgi:hypothetical protein
MIKAGALLYAVIISIVMAIISGSLILSSYLSSIEFQNYQITERLSRDVASGINILLSKQSLILPDQVHVVDLFDLKEDSIKLGRKLWGALEVVTSQAFSMNRKISKIAEIGFSQANSNPYCLYLADQDEPLSVCGKTQIKGLAYLPKAGIKRGFVEGQNYSGSELVNGEIRKSEKKIPELNSSVLDHIKNILSTKNLSENDSVLSIGSNQLRDSIFNSFVNRTLIIKKSGTIKLSGVFSGNIVLASDKQIEISSDVILKDVIICAPKIIIKQGFKGNAQFFATDSIFVDKNVTLFYPSVIGLVNNPKSPNMTTVTLNENDSISGFVFAHREDIPSAKQTIISIPTNSVIHGEVYSNGFVDMRGSIYGSLMCSKILLHTPSSVYENNLLGAIIDRTMLSNYYVGTTLMEESSVKKVIKWLN